MSPFANGTEGDMFIANRCERCMHWAHDEEMPCTDFDPAYFGEWPAIFRRVMPSVANPLGVECSKFEAVTL